MLPDFDPHDPPEEPPPGVQQVLLWRLARQVYCEHRLDPAAAAAHLPPRCRSCRRPWPCNPRRLAEYGMVVAFRPAITDSSRAG